MPVYRKRLSGHIAADPSTGSGARYMPVGAFLEMPTVGVSGDTERTGSVPHLPWARLLAQEGRR